MSVLQADDLVGLTASIFEAVLGRTLEPVDDDVPRASTEQVVSFVAITGEWEGSVGIVMSMTGATRAAADMFAMEEADLDEELVNDAVGELANIAAGNLKGMLVADCKLGLPTVVRGTDFRVSVPGTRVVCEAAFQSDGEPVRVLVQSPTDLPAIG